MKNKIKQFLESFLNRRKLNPPEEMIFVGEGDFETIGKLFLQYFIEIGRLRPNERVLDVGCGIGRMALPLTDYLNSSGNYDGFDIVAQGIDWCKDNISMKYPNFHFQFADIINDAYNPNGFYNASEYKFPYEDESFDFIFLTSVFTHMLPDDMKNYFHEISRVLKKDGRCLATFFLLNDESNDFINSDDRTKYINQLENKLGRSCTELEFDESLRFEFDYGVFRVNDDANPEFAVAYDERFVCNLYHDSGLSIEEPFHYGSWCCRQDFLSFQDIILATKK